jgi:hypothetical protein
MIKPASKLEIHYFFSDSSHSMNAIVRNECEREILQIFKEVANSLDFKIDLESEAYIEGGLREFWKVLGKNSSQITLVLAVITVILSRIPVENKELINLQIENLKLDNEIKRQELKAINERLKSSEEVTNEIVEEVVSKLNQDYKVIWHKSNFYRKLNFYPKVVKLTTNKLDDNNNPIDEEKIVSREEFGKFILHSDEFPEYTDEEAVIDIISPVLKKGKFSWKGFYKDEIIAFQMKDKEFKNLVLNKQIEFVNGIAIKCVLQQKRKIDDYGNIRIIKSNVLTVLEILKSDEREETEQGKKYKRDKKLALNQMKFDF